MAGGPCVTLVGYGLDEGGHIGVVIGEIEGPMVRVSRDVIQWKGVCAPYMRTR